MTMKSFAVGLLTCSRRTLSSKSIGDAGSVSEAKVRIAALKPDVAVLDVRLPDGSGIELCRDLLSDLPELRCLMLTSFTSDEAMLEAILAGASGYVVKDIRGMELATAIKDVGAGKSLLDNRAAAALMAKLRGDVGGTRPTLRTDRPRADATRTSQRRIDQQADRHPDVPGREDCEELRIAAACQARYGAAHPSGGVRLEVGPTVRPADYGYRYTAGRRQGRHSGDSGLGFRGHPSQTGLNCAEGTFAFSAFSPCASCRGP